MQGHVYILGFHAPIRACCASRIHPKTKSMMENLAVQPAVANTRVRMQCVWDNRQRTMAVLFGSGKVIACPRAICALWWNDLHPRHIRLLEDLFAC